MSRTYEIMYLLDNEAVRAGWNEAKAGVAALMEKHGGKVLAARRWDERRLAYPIRRRRRGTYLLVHAEFPPQGVTPLRRELDLTESVLRYLILSVDQVPPAEIELTKAESESGFVVPPPPAEDVVEVEQRASSQDDSDDDSSSEDDSDDGDDDESKAVKVAARKSADRGDDGKKSEKKSAAVSKGAAKEED